MQWSFTTILYGNLLYLLLLLVTTLIHYDEGEVIRVGGRIRGVRDRSNKDFVLGGLFPVHSDADKGAKCGAIRLERGTERMEAMLYAIDLINNDTNLLPNFTLGYDIRDTCNSENIGLDEAIDLVVTGNQLDLESCGDTYGSAFGNSSSSIPTSVVIGAAASAVSVPVATLLRLFKVPQISYASSSARLNNRDRYSYFFRTIPADNLQAEAMIDLCKKFGWKYVSTIYTNNFYGEPGIDEFRKLAAKNGICININEGIDSDFKETDFQRLANQLLNSSANVVVLFASQDNANKLFKQIDISNSLNGTNRRFLWIASDAWARSINVVHQYNESLAGLFGIAPHTEVSNGFMNYFSQLTPLTNKRNPFFEEFYTAYRSCTLNSSCIPYISITSLPKYKQGNFIPLVIDAVFSVAHALQDFFNANCDQPFTWDRSSMTCKGGKRELTGQVLLEYLSNVSFVSPTGRKINFDDEGNTEGQYEILNYQRVNNSAYDFISVGLWNGAQQPGYRLSFHSQLESSLQFGISESGEILTSRESQCQLCQLGQYNRKVEGSCCSTCDDCLGNKTSNSSSATECSTCPFEYWGNNPLSGSNSCVLIDESFLRYDDPWSIVLMIIACLGILAIIFVTIVMVKYWNTPIVKSSAREQMILLLIGISASFLSTFFFVSKPSSAICFFQRFSLWFCFSLILGAILIKLIRIARIFLRATSSSSRPRFTEPYYQVLFTFIIVLVQMILFLISLVVVYPQSSEERKFQADNTLDFPTLVISCKNPHIAMLIIQVVYDTTLIIACNALAILTIRFPENFNESKYVSFSTFALGLIWLAFIPTYFATENESRTAVISFALNLSGFVVLLCIFGPRIFIMIFLPERNTLDFSTHPRKGRSTSVDLKNLDTGCGPSTIFLDVQPSESYN